MTIRIKPAKSNRVRTLSAEHRYMTPHDIAKHTGYDIALVKAALGRKPRDRIKTRAL